MDTEIMDTETMVRDTGMTVLGTEAATEVVTEDEAAERTEDEETIEVVITAEEGGIWAGITHTTGEVVGEEADIRRTRTETTIDKNTILRDPRHKGTTITKTVIKKDTAGMAMNTVLVGEPMTLVMDTRNRCIEEVIEEDIREHIPPKIEEVTMEGHHMNPSVRQEAIWAGKSIHRHRRHQNPRPPNTKAHLGQNLLPTHGLQSSR